MEKLLNETQARLNIFRSIIKTIREAGGEIDNEIIHHALDAAFGASKSLDGFGVLFERFFKNEPCENCTCEKEESTEKESESDE